MKYKARPGIVLARICGRFVLIPTRIASQDCSQIMPIPMTWVIAWDLIKKGQPEEKILQSLGIFKKKTDEELRAELYEVCAKLAERGFLIAEEDSE